MLTMHPAGTRWLVDLVFEELSRADAVHFVVHDLSRDNQYGERPAEYFCLQHLTEAERGYWLDMFECLLKLRCRYDTADDAFIAVMKDYRSAGRWPWEATSGDSHAA